MAQLLSTYKSPFVTTKKGEALKGTITKLTPSEILVDLGAKTEAVVLEKDRRILKSILSTLLLGDTVTVTVLNPESDLGNPVVSLRRFISDMLWEKLTSVQKTQESLQATIREATRGGYLVDIDFGFSAFLPYSQVLPSMENAVGATTQVYVLELNRPARRIIVSQKRALGKEDFEKRIKPLQVGQKITSTVVSVTSFGVFTSLQLNGDVLDGLVHISEVAWNPVENIEKLYSVGQKVACVVVGFDEEARRVELSIKRLTPDPFSKISLEYKVDQKVKGRVKRISNSALFVELDPQNAIEGMMRKEKIPPNVSYEVGNDVEAIVSNIDTKRRKIMLVPSLKAKPIGYR